MGKTAVAKEVERDDQVDETPEVDESAQDAVDESGDQPEGQQGDESTEAGDEAAETPGDENDEAPEGEEGAADDEADADPTAKADDKDDPAARELAILERIGRHLPAEDATDDDAPADDDAEAEQSAAPVGQKAKPAAKQQAPSGYDDAVELSEDDTKYLAQVSEQLGEGADKLVKPLLERTLKAERFVKGMIAQQQQAQQQAAVRAAQDLGKVLGGVAAKGYERVIGKVGKFNPKTGSFDGSTGEQNKVISTILGKSAQIRRNSFEAGDAMSVEESVDAAIVVLKKQKHPAFAALEETVQKVEKRATQTSIPPNRRASGGSRQSADPYAKAAAKADAWYRKNGIKTPR
jgi:hypothetical protein